jgi:hypothetical protein
MTQTYEEIRQAQKARDREQSELGLNELKEAHRLLQSAIGRPRHFMAKSTGGEYPTSLPHPIQWDVEKLFSVVRSDLKAMTEWE